MISNPTTQKAKGIKFIADQTRYRKGALPEVFSGRLCQNAFLTDREGSHCPTEGPVEVFLRPCPSRPRHGFVDSRGVKMDSTQHNFLIRDVAKQVMALALLEDCHAELVVMPLFRGTHSAVMTSYSFVFARGTTGATSGKHVLVDLGFPFTHDEEGTLLFEQLFGTGRSQESIGIFTSAYYEILYKQQDHDPYPELPELVQLRDGVIPPAQAGEYIPYPFTLDQLQYATGPLCDDLIRWEAFVLKVADTNKAFAAQGSPYRDMIVLPYGTTATSHMAVHCLANEVPYTCRDRNNQVSQYQHQRLAPSETPPIERWCKYDIRGSYTRALEDTAIPQYVFRNLYLNNAITGPLHESLGAVMKVCLVAAHHGTFWHGRNGNIRLWVACAVAYVRICTAICLGEHRHPPKTMFDEDGDPIPGKTLTRYPALPKGFGYRGQSRSVVCLRGLTIPWDKIPGYLEKIVRDFDELTWQPGFGGHPWARGTEQVLKLWHALERIASGNFDASQREIIMEIMTCWHNSINATHNKHVPLVTKVVELSDLDDAQFTPMNVLTQPSVHHFLTTFLQKGI